MLPRARFRRCDLALAIYRWCKRLFLGRWERAYLFFVTLTFREIHKKYGPQAAQAWELD